MEQVYVTLKVPPKCHQMTLEELFSSEEYHPEHIGNVSNTRTYFTSSIPERLSTGYNIDQCIRSLERFNKLTENIRAVSNRRDLYDSWVIPKKSGGLRHIDAPKQELQQALTMLKNIFENEFGALYHTSAFAYIKKRSCIMALKKHQSNESKWFAKLDLSNFFGSTTLDYTINMLSRIFPFSEIIKDEKGKEELSKAIELAFLDGGLPQGTTLSPMLTNIIMIPIDFTISKKLRELETNYVYTRYSDDMFISSRYNFDFHEIEDLINETLKQFGAPYLLNKKKTRYGSSSGSNWNLGLMLNKDNEITIGHKKKREFKAMLTSYVLDRKNEKPWDIHDIQTMNGLKSYYCSVEKQNIMDIIKHINEKFKVDIEALIKADLAL